MTVKGDLEALLRVPDRLEQRPDLTLGLREKAGLLAQAARLGAIGPPPPPPEEAQVAGRLHSRLRDRRAVTHHYDVGNEFYRLLLGPSMTYSCAYWPSEPGQRGAAHLDDAQAAKHELVCRKLGLQPGMRLLDIGCGWGSMAIHAARYHDAQVTAVTISPEQAALARTRVREAGLDDRVEVRLCDYRDVTDGPYDAVSSIGMAEHVGAAMLPTYAATVVRLLRHEGRYLHHAISRRPGPVVDPRRSVLVRYVFPDGEPHPLGTTVSVLEGAGLEVRDVEALREHYALTLRAWLERLDRHRAEAEAEALTSPGRVRVFDAVPHSVGPGLRAAAHWARPGPVRAQRLLGDEWHSLAQGGVARCHRHPTGARRRHHGWPGPRRSGAPAVGRVAGRPEVGVARLSSLGNGGRVHPPAEAQ